MSASNEEKQRIDGLDGWRTLAVLCMISWHLLWDLGQSGLDWAVRWALSPAGSLVRSFTAFSFILLSGISCRFSHSNIRRGLRTLLCALLVTAASWAAGSPVWFGILHLLGCCMLLFAALDPRLARYSPQSVASVCLLLFVPLFLWLPNVCVRVPGLWVLGLRTVAFSSADYYPLLPWALLFFAGTALGEIIRDAEGCWKEQKLPGFLTWPGRHALPIYLLHQPLLFLLIRLCAGMR